MAKIYIDIDANPVRECNPKAIRGSRGRFGSVRNLDDDQLAEVGIVRAEVMPVETGMVPTGEWRAEYDGTAHVWRWVPICITQAEADAAAAAELAQADAQQQAYLAALDAQVGPLVELVRGHLVALGYDLPCESASVIGEVATRSALGQLSPEQEVSKGDAIDLYGILSRSLSDQQIADVWAYRQAQQEVPNA